jgi:hypothetical protein
MALLTLLGSHGSTFYLPGDGKSFINWNRPPADAISESWSFHQLHHKSGHNSRGGRVSLQCAGSIVRSVWGPVHSRREGAAHACGAASHRRNKRCIFPRECSEAHHSPKPFARENTMRLETILRGTGDIGAMVATCWGIKQLDSEENIIHVENVKPRDFQPPRPFQLIGRPHISDQGDFRLYKAPRGMWGACRRAAAGPRQRGRSVFRIHRSAPP